MAITLRHYEWPKGTCLHAEVAFRHAGVAISHHEIASVLPLVLESLAPLNTFKMIIFPHEKEAHG